MIVLKTVMSGKIGVEDKKIIYDTLSDIEAIRREDAKVSQPHGWDTFDGPLDNTTLMMYNLKSTNDQFIQKNPGKYFKCKSKYPL